MAPAGPISSAAPLEIPVWPSEKPQHHVWQTSLCADRYQTGLHATSLGLAQSLAWTLNYNQCFTTQFGFRRRTAALISALPELTRHAGINMALHMASEGTFASVAVYLVCGLLIHKLFPQVGIIAGMLQDLIVFLAYWFILLSDQELLVAMMLEGGLIENIFISQCISTPLDYRKSSDSLHPSKTIWIHHQHPPVQTRKMLAWCFEWLKHWKEFSLGFPSSSSSVWRSYFLAPLF